MFTKHPTESGNRKCNYFKRGHFCLIENEISGSSFVAELMLTCIIRLLINQFVNISDSNERRKRSLEKTSNASNTWSYQST